MVQQQATRETETGRFIKVTGPRGITGHASKSHMGKSRQEAEAAPCCMPLLGSVGGLHSLHLCFLG